MLHCLSIQYNKYIQHHFFASYHGHSIADGHAGSVKTAVKKKFIEMEGERRRHNSSQVDGPINASQVQQIIDNRFENGNVFTYVFEQINRNEILKLDVDSIPQIKSYHRFDHFPSGQCNLYVTSQSNESISHQFSYKKLKLN